VRATQRNNRKSDTTEQSQERHNGTIARATQLNNTTENSGAIAGTSMVERRVAINQIKSNWHCPFDLIELLWASHLFDLIELDLAVNGRLFDLIEFPVICNLFDLIWFELTQFKLS
jgi:hypothetical protein